MTDDLSAVLELREACPVFEESGLTSIPYSLRLMPGDCMLIACRDSERTTRFADLCAGMAPLVSGQVLCQGLDWEALAEPRAWALRGRIGRVMQQGAWIDLFGTDLNILLQQLHHTRTPTEELIDEAIALSRRFGLPGLPTLTPGRLSVADRAKAACVRAFLGEPKLLLLEDPVELETADMMTAFLAELTAARERGCGVIWFSREPDLWRGYHAEGTQRYRLLDEGLLPMKQVV
ncbi:MULTISPECIES: P-loop NTPase family protein [Asaia]|uniref:ABC transporter system ATP-binding protein n=1 Tax=Asaia bogorensis TaxID=91915 RepID=A0A060QFJ1_9PROT|nr:MULTISPECIES: ABC transporter ATP-binding protein [Asaia]ETC99097.1 ABC transporter ATP-binding protein [Asaia sp. SF2.1]CDG39904.1 Putative ABC transporter system ATP-binding protein [Asaia bogorensis]